MTYDMKLCIVIILLCFWLMSSEDPNPKRRKCAAKTLKSKMAMTSATGKSINKDKKDSPSPAAPSSFPVGSTVFGAPTYFPATNPWQNDQNVTRLSTGARRLDRLFILSLFFFHFHLFC